MVEAWLRLAFVSLPAPRSRRLLAYYGNPQDALSAADAGHDQELLQISGVTPKVIDRLREATARDLTPVWRAMREHAIRLLLSDAPDYPPALHALGDDAPPYLFMRGDVQESDRRAVAIVGTRGASEYGRGLAERLAVDLARRGVTVVSGLARGIDTHAHEGALQAGGRTFAVCGCGLDIAYPSDNRELMSRVAQNGAAFSEWAPTTHPEAWHFPARNRIISGLSLGSVIVEAGERSGALITAEFAIEQGREVFAIPGNVHRPGSKGPHALIKQGATLVESADDIIEALNARVLPFDVPAKTTRASDPKPRARREKAVVTQTQMPLATDDDLTGEQREGATGRLKGGGSSRSMAREMPAMTGLTPEQDAVYGALEEDPRHLDDVALRANVGAAEAAATLVLLELRGIVRRHPGGLFSRSF